MHPICVLLPVGHDAAYNLWTVLELGYQMLDRHDRVGGSIAASPDADDQTDHLRILAGFVRERLVGGMRTRRALWLERRELTQLLMLMDCGLHRLEQIRTPSDSTFAALDAVEQFLTGLQAQLGTIRKPVKRQAAARPRIVAAVGH